MNPNTDPAPACPSCGTPWTEHPGITATCAEVKRLTGIIERAQLAFFADDKSDGTVAADMLRILYSLKPLPTKQP
jgi:hypothetical protein